MTHHFSNPWAEEVNGTVIGAFTTPYEFWADEPRQEYQTKRGTPKRRVCAGHFENDDQAIAFVKERFPYDFKRGLEMRVFDV